MKLPKRLATNIAAAMLVTTAGCAGTGKQPAPVVSRDRVAGSETAAATEIATVAGRVSEPLVSAKPALGPHSWQMSKKTLGRRTSPAEQPHSIPAHASATADPYTSVQPVAYTLPANLVFAAEPLEAMEGQLIDARPALTLAEVEQYALANNPSIAWANAASSKSAGLLCQVGVKPNPTLGYLGNQIAAEGTDQHVVFVEQEFVRGDKLQLNKEVLRHTVGAQRWELEVQRQRVLTDIRTRFYEAAAAQLQLEAIDEFARVASRGVQIAADRLQAEEASKVDLLQARIMSSEINLSRQRTEAAYLGAWKDLAAVAGIPDSQPIELEGAFSAEGDSLDWEATYADLLARSPELSVARELVCEKHAHLKRQKAQPVPNVTAGLGAGYDAGTESGLINLLVAAPIPIKNRNHGNIAAAYADYVRAVENLNRIELTIRARLARVSQDYDAALASVRKYKQEILPQAEESLALSEEAYAAGQLEFLQVLVVRRRYFDSTLAYIDAQADFAIAAAKIQGLLLTGGLDAPRDYTSDDGLRDQSFGGQ